MRNPEALQRRKPRQARSQATVDSIVEAALQLAERGGPLDTNAIAERAGVSVGTLYRYFPHKEAILLAAARRTLSGAHTGVSFKMLLALLADTLEMLLGGGVPALATTAHRAAPRRRTAANKSVATFAVSWLPAFRAVRA